MSQQRRDGIRSGAERPAAPNPPNPAAPPAPAANPPGRLEGTAPWNWRLIVFLWITALVFLGVYEFVAAFIQAFFRSPASP